jgi:hypothetical protein
MKYEEEGGEFMGDSRFKIQVCDMYGRFGVVHRRLIYPGKCAA